MAGLMDKPCFEEAFRLKFDCKRCEMHVLGKLKQPKGQK